jgi:hypothetical protein
MPALFCIIAALPDNREFSRFAPILGRKRLGICVA